MFFDLIKPSIAIVGALILGPLISSDFETIFFGRPSKTITNLLGVEYEELFLKEINFSLITDIYFLIYKN